ncbi:probable E3 ubiquitin-protein ligase HERC4 isoform X2 [Artemia franciscana]|uniref:probable E3 ubiquitin-protein ligase HERC4 isoform X2 n=1 Tax=Artemia franciscana TaxID=6661 RepID=UPI0032DBC0D8
MTIKRPVDNLEYQKILKAAAGFAHSLALDQQGQIFSWGLDSSGQLGAVFGWGRNDNGQLGLGDRYYRATPYLLSSLEDKKIVYMCCGRDQSVALNKV